MMGRFLRLAKCHQGAVAIEFAIIGGLAVVILLGSIEYGTWIRDQRLAASTSTAAAQSIADSGISTSNTRAELETALKIMSGRRQEDLGLNVYNVTSNNKGDVSVSDTWSTGNQSMTASAAAGDWEIIKPYLTPGEGGVVACAYKKHSWNFLKLGQNSGTVVKSCNAAVPVATNTVDWE